MNMKKILLLISVVLVYSPLSVTNVTADTRLQNMPIKNSHGSRIDRTKMKKCKNCRKDMVASKFKYFERMVAAKPSGEFQKLVEAKIFASDKFKSKCWASASKKGIDFFFTINKKGEPTDFAWFPKDRAGKCIARHIAGLEFPQPEETHYSWLAVTNIDLRLVQR